MEDRKKRILMSVIGVVICGVSVGFFKRASFGIDPFQSMMSGLAAVIPISFGLLYVIVNLCLLLISLINDRSKIGIATFINLFLLGYIVDYSHQFILKLFPELGIAGRLIMLVIGVVILCLSSSLYFTADLGVSTYDAVALILSEKWKVMPFKFWRITTDLCCVLLGIALYLLSGNPISGLAQIIGVGTVIIAFFMGPLIDWFNRHVSQKLLSR